MLYHFVILLLSAKKLNHVRVSIDHRLVHYILANPKAKITINNNSQFTSLTQTTPPSIQNLLFWAKNYIANEKRVNQFMYQPSL